MLNKFCKKPLYEVTRTMARVAMGVQKAETVIKNARLVNVCTAEIQEGIDVAIAEGRIALVGDASHCIGPETKVIDASGQYIAPGFMDGHIHVESSMISVVIPRNGGTARPTTHTIVHITMKCTINFKNFDIGNAPRFFWFL